MSRFVCLMYHDVCPAHEAATETARLSPSIRSYTVTTEQFRAHLAAVGPNRWLDPAELKGPATAIADASSPRVLLTFDDGWAGSILEAGPILKEHGARAIVFVTTGLIGHPLFVSQSLLSELAEDTFAIGAHTVTHPDLASLSDDDVIRHEVNESRSRLRSVTGREIATFALPHGAFDDRVLRAARAAGYRRVLTLEDDLEPRGRDDGVIARFSASPDITRAEFRLLIDGAYGWLGGFRRFVRRLKGNA